MLGRRILLHWSSYLLPVTFAFSIVKDSVFFVLGVSGIHAVHCRRDAIRSGCDCVRPQHQRWVRPVNACWRVLRSSLHLTVALLYVIFFLFRCEQRYWTESCTCSLCSYKYSRNHDLSVHTTMSIHQTRPDLSLVYTVWHTYDMVYAKIILWWKWRA